MSDSTIVTPDGQRIHVVVQGAGSPVVVLHGFTGSGDAMASVTDGLAAAHTTIAVDLLGHGASSAPRYAGRYDVTALLADLRSVVAALDLTRPGVVGYSLGGRLALSWACAEPATVSRVAVIGTGAGMANDEERAGRWRSDEDLAMLVEREGIESFADFWMSVPLVATQEEAGKVAWREARRSRLKQAPAGVAGMLRGFGQGSMPPLQAALTTLAVPLLLLVGERDAEYVAIAREVVRLAPNATMATVPGAGHAPHLSAAGPTVEHLRAFFGEVA